MNSALINIKTDPKIKKQAQKVAKNLGFSLSSLLNAYLRHFVETETVFFSSRYEEPTQYLLDIVEKSKKEIAKGNYHKFSDLEDSLKFLDEKIPKANNNSKKTLPLSNKEKSIIISKIKKTLKKQDQVLFAYIFGSFLYSPNPRDIDIAVYLKSANKKNMLKLETHIADKIGKEINIPFDRIDLRIVNFSPDSFLANVFSRGTLLFAKDKNIVAEMIERVSLEALKNDHLSSQSFKEISYQ